MAQKMGQWRLIDLNGSADAYRFCSGSEIIAFDIADCALERAGIATACPTLG
jgi:hypothetical protein